MGWKFENYQKNNFVIILLERFAFNKPVFLETYFQPAPALLLCDEYYPPQRVCVGLKQPDAGNDEVSVSVAAAAPMERSPPAASYATATVTTAAPVSWTPRPTYLCVCEYFAVLWALNNMTLHVHGTPALLSSLLGGNAF